MNRGLKRWRRITCSWSLTVAGVSPMNRGLKPRIVVHCKTNSFVLQEFPR